MNVHPIPTSDGPKEPEGTGSQPVLPVEPSPDLEVAPTSVLDLVNRTLADTARTANAATIITTAAKGVVKVVLSMGLVLVIIVVLTGLLIHFAGLGPALGGAIAVGGTTAVAGGRYLWNRRVAKRRSGTKRQRTAPNGPQRP